jgi:hypothetical protein
MLFDWSATNILISITEISENVAYHTKFCVPVKISTELWSTISTQHAVFVYCITSLELSFFVCYRWWKEFCYKRTPNSKVAAWTQMQGQAWWLYKIAAEQDYQCQVLCKSLSFWQYLKCNFQIQDKFTKAICNSQDPMPNYLELCSPCSEDNYFTYGFPDDKLCIVP